MPPFNRGHQYNHLKDTLPTRLENLRTPQSDYRDYKDKSLRFSHSRNRGNPNHLQGSENVLPFLSIPFLYCDTIIHYYGKNVNRQNAQRFGIKFGKVAILTKLEGARPRAAEPKVNRQIAQIGKKLHFLCKITKKSPFFRGFL